MLHKCRIDRIVRFDCGLWVSQQHLHFTEKRNDGGGAAGLPHFSSVLRPFTVLNYYTLQLSLHNLHLTTPIIHHHLLLAAIKYKASCIMQYCMHQQVGQCGFSHIMMHYVGACTVQNLNLRRESMLSYKKKTAEKLMFL